MLLALTVFCCCFLLMLSLKAAALLAAAADDDDACRLVAEQLYAQGLFGLFHFPIMLTTALERYM
jgi:hypothetical protein